MPNIKNKSWEKVAAPNHKFTMDLYRALYTSANDDENVFFSPFSIYVALVLVYLGSGQGSKTAQELYKSLFLQLMEREHLLEGVRQLLNDLKKQRELIISTNMFVEKTFILHADYKKEAEEFLKSNSQIFNFKEAAEEATHFINSWVSSHTKNKIKDLIPAGSLDESTKLVLVNATHFKDKWITRFDQACTDKQKFFTSENCFEEVDMMHVTADFRYCSYDTFKVLELPYKNEHFKMIIILPTEINGLPAVEEKLPELKFADVLNDIRQEEVELSLPKFKLEKFFDMKKAIQKLGISAVFDRSQANLTRIHEPTEDEDLLYVSEIMHKSYIEVNEEGTEAAAATGLEFSLLCSCPPPPVKFSVDHPFIFFILFKDVILFSGRQLSITGRKVDV